MMMRGLGKLILLGAIVAGLNLQAQQSATFYNMQSVEQSNTLNPSRMPDNKLNIGIP